MDQAPPLPTVEEIDTIYLGLEILQQSFTIQNVARNDPAFITLADMKDFIATERHRLITTGKYFNVWNSDRLELCLSAIGMVEASVKDKYSRFSLKRRQELERLKGIRERLTSAYNYTFRLENKG